MSFDSEKTRESVAAAIRELEAMEEHIKKTRENLKGELQRKIESLQGTKIQSEFLDPFFEEPYVIVPKKANEWYVIVPKWLDFHVGWLERSTKSYNVFVINKYVQWFSEIPTVMRERLKFQDPLPFKVFDGVLLTGEKLQEEGLRRYKNFIYKRQGSDRLRVKKGYEFKLIAQLIEDGTLPFVATPVNEEDLREWDGLELRSYQKTAWKSFLQMGATGVFWAFGAGKSLYGIYTLGRIKGKKLVVVPSNTLKEQWNERIYDYLHPHQHEIEVINYRSYEKVKNKEYSLTLFDECQHLPATTFIRLATLRTKYRIGFSGSPYREDGRENFVIALTGFPIGMSWDELIKMQVVKKPSFRVYILRDQKHKMKKLEELLRIPIKTLIFCDWLKLGEKISKAFGIPFIHHGTKGRLPILRQSMTSVISKVGDEGVSLHDLERVIEFAFLFGSRMQESQRFGRLMHSIKEEPQHIILMTEDEFKAYKKRLNAIIERGFRIEYLR